MHESGRKRTHDDAGRTEPHSPDGRPIQDHANKQHSQHQATERHPRPKYVPQPARPQASYQSSDNGKKQSPVQVHTGSMQGNEKSQGRPWNRGDVKRYYTQDQTRVHMSRALDLDDAPVPPSEPRSAAPSTPPTTPESGKPLELTIDEKSMARTLYRDYTPVEHKPAAQSVPGATKEPVPTPSVAAPSKGPAAVQGEPTMPDEVAPAPTASGVKPSVSVPPPAIEPEKCPRQRCVSKEQTQLEHQKFLEFQKKRRDKRRAARDRRRERMRTVSGYIIDDVATERRRRARQRKKAAERGELSDSEDGASELDSDYEAAMVEAYLQQHPEQRIPAKDQLATVAEGSNPKSQ